MSISDEEFEQLIVTALYIVSERECAGAPSDEELEQLIQPSPHSQRRMNAIIRNPNKYIRNYRRPLYLKVLRNAAAVFIVITILLGAAMAVSPTVRAAVIDFVRSWFEDRTEYWTPDNPLDGNWSFNYIPQGFNKVMDMTNEIQIVQIYENEATTLISIEISAGQKAIDNEHSVFYQTVISGRTVHVYEAISTNYNSILVIYDKTEGVFITLTSPIPINELIRIAENIS